MSTAPTHDEVEKWTAELVEIEKKMAELTERKALLRQVLDTMPAIEKLRGNAPLTVEEKASDDHSRTDEGLKLVNAIPRVLYMHKKAMLPNEIKQHLKDVGFTRSFGETYFYTAIKRAVEKGAITKSYDGRYTLTVTNGDGTFTVYR